MVLHERCLGTPLIALNHYWDGIPEAREWRDQKPLYLMSNIEMNELPRNPRVIYTRHTSSDVVMLARVRFGDAAIAPKNFSEVRFVHVVDTSVEKSTREVVNCWLERLDFPPLDTYISNNVYEGWFKEAYDESVRRSKMKLRLGRVDSDDFGRVIAETACFLCASAHESCGQYTNQARASNAVIVKTDVPSMNEQLLRQSGLLIPSNRLTIHLQLMRYGYDHTHGLRDVKDMTAGFESDGICRAVERVLAMSPGERELMAVRARKQSLIDMTFFAVKMQELCAIARDGNDDMGNLWLRESAWAADGRSPASAHTRSLAR